LCPIDSLVKYKTNGEPLADEYQQGVHICSYYIKCPIFLSRIYKNHKAFLALWFIVSGDGRDRTVDLLNAIQALSRHIGCAPPQNTFYL